MRSEFIGYAFPVYASLILFTHVCCVARRVLYERHLRQTAFILDTLRRRKETRLVMYHLHASKDFL